jgi:hypothetical protein
MATAPKKAAVKEAPVKSKKSAGIELSTKNIARLKAIGINATMEEDAKEKMMVIFKKNGLDDMGNDSINDLIEIVEAFPETGKDEPEEVDEVVEEKPKAAKGGKKVKKSEPEPEPEEDVEEELDEEVAEEEPDEIPEEEEEVVEEKSKSKKAGKDKKVAKTKTEEADEEADALVEEVEEKDLKVPKKRQAPPVSDKKAKKKSTRVRKLQGKHWEDLTLAEKDKAVKPLRKFLPEAQYRFEYLTKSVVVKYIGKTNEHNIFKYHLLRLLENGKLEGVCLSHRFKTAEEFQGYLPEDLGGAMLKTGVSCSYIQPFHQDQLMELLGETDFLKDSIAIVTKQDTKMKVNREKLEQQLNGKGGDKKVSAKTDKTTKKAKEVEPEEEEEEEVVEEEPKKSAKKVAKKEVPVPVKKVVAKAVAAKKPEPAKVAPKKKK